jgi:hypothetical protein
MAIITCSDCGRAVSDRASACIGCGAPLASRSAFDSPAFDMVPRRSDAPPLSAQQRRWRLALASLTLVLGVIAADAVGHRPGGGRLAATLAALLVICGLCWFIVAILQSVQSRR